MNMGRGWIDRLVRCYEGLVAGLVVLLFADVIWGVVSRYLLGRQSQWTEELAVNLLLWVSMLGAALAYRDRGHLGVDLFTQMLAPPARRLANLAAELAVLGFAGFALIYGGGLLVLETLAANQVTPAMGWKVSYFYAAVPVAGVFFVLFSLEHFVSLLRIPVEQPAEGKGSP